MTYEQFIRDCAELQPGKGVQITWENRAYVRRAMRNGMGMKLSTCGGRLQVFVMDDEKRDPLLREYYHQSVSA